MIKKRRFKEPSFPKSIISQVLYFNFRFGLSYRGIEELMIIRDVKIDYTDIQFWVFKFTQLLEKEESSWKKMGYE